MKKLLFFAFIVLASCSSPKMQFAENFDKSDFVNYKIKIQSLKINFKERRILPIFKKNPEKYLSKEEIDKIILDQVNETLERDGFLAKESDKNVFEVEATIDLDRIYLIFSANTYIGTLHQGHKINFYKNKKIVAYKSNNSRHFAKLGFKERSKKFGKNILLSYSKEDEKKEVIHFAKYFAKELEELTCPQ